ncbi:hypothetical protein SAMN04487764_1813 [Gillisia sp. Hel1_33_143]|uniref:hypothetical protein n=1 Tax=unclassified Gillisia TaxID=2615025 RepID=UPI00055455B7|nr:MULTISPECIES: hypothetical protein [unclassified Gillisia]SDS26214.1 hypothetical protein SAMN04487764_1813 [Gillisia sp. Hel1_33_143]
MDNSENSTGLQLDRIEIRRIIAIGKKKGSNLGMFEFKGELNSLRVHSINNEHLAEMVHEYMQDIQLAYIRHKSYYKIAITSFRSSKDKIIAKAKLYNETIDPENKEQETNFAASMYESFIKTQPDFGLGIDILEEIKELENVVTIYECLEEKKRRVDAIINETTERIRNKENVPVIYTDKDSQIFNTVWEAVIYHSVLVDIDPKKYIRSKKDIPDLVQTWIKPDGKAISPNTFYQKLQKIQMAKKGIADPKHGKYTINDYESVKQRLIRGFPQAVSVLELNYYHNELY